MIDVHITGNKELRLSHPESWAEVKPEQFRGISVYLAKDVVSDDDRIQIARIMLSLSNADLYRLRNMEGFQIEHIINLHDFIFAESSFDRWMLENIYVGEQCFYGPEDNFRNVTWDEFVYCDTYLMLYCENKEDQYLDKLIATIYRLQSKEYDPESPTYKGDIREDFNENTITVRADLLGCFIEKTTKDAIVINLRAVRKNIEKQYPYLFPQTDFEEAVAVKKKPRKNAVGWENVTRTLCDFADIDKVGKMPAHNILFELNERIKESKRK